MSSSSRMIGDPAGKWGANELGGFFRKDVIFDIWTQYLSGSAVVPAARGGRPLPATVRGPSPPVGGPVQLRRRSQGGAPVPVGGPGKHDKEAKRKGLQAILQVHEHEFGWVSLIPLLCRAMSSTFLALRRAQTQGHHPYGASVVGAQANESALVGAQPISGHFLQAVEKHEELLFGLRGLSGFRASTAAARASASLWPISFGSGSRTRRSYLSLKVQCTSAHLHAVCGTVCLLGNAREECPSRNAQVPLFGNN